MYKRSCCLLIPVQLFSLYSCDALNNVTNWCCSSHSLPVLLGFHFWVDATWALSTVGPLAFLQLIKKVQLNYINVGKMAGLVRINSYLKATDIGLSSNQTYNCAYSFGLKLEKTAVE